MYYETQNYHYHHGTDSSLSRCPCTGKENKSESVVRTRANGSLLLYRRRRFRKADSSYRSHRRRQVFLSRMGSPTCHQWLAWTCRFGNQQTGPRFLLRRSHRRRIDEPQPTHQEISRTIVRSQRYSRYRFQPHL